MKNVWSAVFLLFSLKLTSSKISCPPNDNCLCIPGQEFEFQCPKNYRENGFIIHIVEDEEVLIDCSLGLDKFYMNRLPNITLHRTEKFKIRFCPLPENGFQEVLDWFIIEEVKLFVYESYTLDNVTLTKNYFKGLDFLEGLILKENELINLEEDVFANTPKLTSLELQKNNIRLKRHLFKYTPLLKTLDIAENKLETIPEGLFEGLDKLEILHLWGNNLSEINDFTFQGLTSLKSLELSGNRIESISESAFKALRSLSSVSLSKNALKTLPEDVFSYNTKLELISLKSNPKISLPQYLFSNLSHLEKVDLSNCNIDNIPENIFENSENIKTIILSGNSLTSLPNDLFKHLSKLEQLNLSYNKLEQIDGVFSSLKKLKILFLENNFIRELGSHVFTDLINLEEISLRENQITIISDLAFSNNEQLKRIDLSSNKYSGGDQFRLLENVNKVENIDLSYNQITDINDVIVLYNKPKVKYLNLSHNRITYLKVKHLQPIVKKLTVNLEYNHITIVDFKGVDLITSDVKDAYFENDPFYSVVFLAYNPIQCDCTNYDLLRYVKNEMPEVRVMFDIKTEGIMCAAPRQLKHMKVESVPPRLLLCSFEQLSFNASCPERCSCNWRPQDKSLIMDCSGRNFSEFPKMNLSEITVGFKQIDMHLEGNSLVTGPQKDLMYYENITKLHLSYNEIVALDWVPPKLEVLHLDNNKLKHMNYEILNKLNASSMRNLTLEGNPWLCDCGAANFTNFLRQHTKMVDARNIQCSNSSRFLRDLNKNDLCQEWQLIYTVLIVLLILFPCTVFVALFYRYQQEVKVFLYAHNLCLFWVTEEELDKDKLYDAFISYSHKDEDFVVQDLLPVLEGGNKPYRLCLHYRDWIPGEFITTQVTNSVLESRRTLVVLSKNFLESVWGKMEFRTAHTQAMTEGRARVIIVLYGDVDVDKLDDELTTYMKTNTYVKWGDPYFWNKLKYALPHSKQVTNNNQKIVNVMRCIDDKFKLVAPVTPSPGSTPPVLSLDANGLKKHPLNFVSSPETPPAEAGNLLVSTNL